MYSDKLNKKLVKISWVSMIISVVFLISVTYIPEDFSFNSPPSPTSSSDYQNYIRKQIESTIRESGRGMYTTLSNEETLKMSEKELQARMSEHMKELHQYLTIKHADALDVTTDPNENYTDLAKRLIEDEKKIKSNPPKEPATFANVMTIISFISILLTTSCTILTTSIAFSTHMDHTLTHTSYKIDE